MGNALTTTELLRPFAAAARRERSVGSGNLISLRSGAQQAMILQQRASRVPPDNVVGGTFMCTQWIVDPIPIVTARFAQDSERDQDQEQTCVRDSVLEAIGGNVAAAAAGMRTVMEARAAMQAAMADLAANDTALHTALLDVQSKQSAATEALTYSKGTSGTVPGHRCPNARAQQHPVNFTPDFPVSLYTDIMF